MKAFPFNDRVAHGIMMSLSILTVLTAIHLDDDAAIKADEVKIVASERRLPSNVKPQRTQSLEAGP